MLPLACGVDSRALVHAALAQAHGAVAGARFTATAAVTHGAATIVATINRGDERHEAQRRPQNETVHGKTLFA